MKKQRYVVEIEMPDGDFISAGWLKDLIQTDCDVEDESRKKVTVQETSLPSNLDEAAEQFFREFDEQLYSKDTFSTFNRMAFRFKPKDIKDSFKAGAEWMMGQGETRELTVERPVLGPPMICCPVRADNGDKVVVQIRKK